MKIIVNDVNRLFLEMSEDIFIDAAIDLPSVNGFFESHFLLPILAYFIMFTIIRQAVKFWLWKDHTGFQYVTILLIKLQETYS